GFDADHTDRIAAQMRIPDHSRLGSPHAGPSLQGSMVLIDNRHHDFANVEGSFTSGICLLGENIPHTGEAAVPIFSMAKGLHITINRVGSCGSSWKALPRHNIGVLIVTEQDVTRLIDITGPILGLPIQAHDAIVATNALVVLRRDT